ncbi:MULTISPECIES: TDT family transporter [Tsukamurella]|uniref:C4-dicarboxylate ABC transporter n=2 Tax=Tsukamurella TaxID=2060 RepID=A0A5C5S015_9ACTN|nr:MULTISPECIES: TDT family transporter [Tsukamurella]NMD54282.1 TDT family transporter [Tsukamurella columbiensis]TWS28202.1 C4-dicarboxylate ABC transporter [Tsukamurella conjunctivitidis]
MLVDIRPTTRPAARPALFRDLPDRRTACSNITPNWFASVMGTGIIANAAVSLPVHVPGLRTAAAAVWAVATVLLVVLLVATAAHWARYPHFARRHHRDPVIGNFYGAMAMALLTVGSGAVLVGRDWIGQAAALTIGTGLWLVGTLLGIVFAVMIPVLMAKGGHYTADRAFAGWLMPVVSPMVTAAGGAVLLPYAPEGTLRAGLLWFCYGCVAFSVLASIVVMPAVVARLVRRAPWPAAMVPTAWIMLGPMGQSITAVNSLGADAHLVVGGEAAHTLTRFGLVYGWVVTVPLLAWTVVALVLTARTAVTSGLPYALTWWSFTFPIGTCATGFSGMAAHTGVPAYTVLAIAYFLTLVIGWIVAVRGTVPRAIVSGDLLRHPELAR